MEPRADRNYVAFAGHKLIAKGDILTVATKVKKHLKADTKAAVLIFDRLSSHQVEIDFRGTVQSVIDRLNELLKIQDISDENKRPGPGRPKLGVTPKEVTLLPDHWEWLARQPGGASVTLRRLVEEARKKNKAKDLLRAAQESTHKFMTAVAGDLPEYEEALRALYAGDKKNFVLRLTKWPKDLSEYTLQLAEPAFAK